MHHPPPSFVHYFEQRLQQLYHDQWKYRNTLEEKIKELETHCSVLQEKLEQIKPIHIENINYKIQELSVKELSGTLNIGLTALSDPEELKKWLSGPAKDEDNDVQMNDIEQPMQDPTKMYKGSDDV